MRKASTPPRVPKRLVIVYSVLAVVATTLNILSQAAVIRVYSGENSIIVSMAIGTIIGLVAKYVLDKRYIFCVPKTSLRKDAFIFGLYMATGLVTTAIFWCVELGFYYVYETSTMRYLGGVIGLSIGYYCKYQLDRRYVFPGYGS